MHSHFAVMIPAETLSQSEPTRQESYHKHVVLKSGTLLNGRRCRIKPAALEEETTNETDIS